MTCLHSNRESRGISATRYFCRRDRSRPRRDAQRVTLHPAAAEQVSLRLRKTSVYSVRRRCNRLTTSNLYPRPDSPSCDSFAHDPYGNSHDIHGTLMAMLATAYILLPTTNVRLRLVLFLILTEHQLAKAVPQVFEQAFAVAALLCQAFVELQSHHHLLHSLALVSSLNPTISTGFHGLRVCFLT